MKFSDVITKAYALAEQDFTTAQRWLFDSLRALPKEERINNLYRVENKDFQRVPFRMNAEQNRFWKESGGNHFNNILKSRQIGFTTLAAVLEYDAAVFEGESCGIMAHVMDNVLKIFQQKFKVIHDCFMQDWGKWIPLVTKSESRTELYFSHIELDPPILLNSFVKVAYDFKGATLKRLHRSEAAFMEDQRLTESAQCVPFSGYITDETTPNGMGGLFYRNWQQAKAGNSRFKNFFAPWFLHYPEEGDPIKAEEFKAPKTAKEIEVARVARERWGVEIDERHLQWRRVKIAELGGDESEFERLYPSDEDLCFLTGERQFFPSSLLTALARRVKDPLVGELVDEGGLVKFVEDPNGRFFLWNKPRSGHTYAIGLDSATGIGSDSTCAKAINRTTGVIDIELYGQLEVDEAAECAIKLARYCNSAHICPEENGCGLAVIENLKKRGWRKFYKRRHVNNVDGGASFIIGFSTTRAEKRRICDNLLTAIRNGACRPLSPLDLKEMSNFILDPRGGLSAKSGEHDDRVMALALAVEMDNSLPPAQDGDNIVEIPAEYDPTTGAVR